MYIKMKKILIPLACLSALTLSACQTSTKPTGQASSSKTAGTHKSSSKSKAAPKESSQAKKPKSAKQSSAVKNSSSSASSKASSSSSSPTSSSSSNAPAGYQALFEVKTLTSFVNKYGESPAAYLSEHYGLSPKEALYATPDSLETFGEMQSESMYRKGQDPFAN